jgi:DNA-binding MarR family transcriptional regulator
LTQQIFEAIKSLQQFQINCLNMVSSLTHAQTFVLLTVGDFISKHKCSPQPSLLSEYLQVAPASITPILNKLDNAGLIERVYSKQDRRQVFIDLTPKGKECYDTMITQIRAYYQKAIDEIGEQSIAQFVAFGKKIDAFNTQTNNASIIPPVSKHSECCADTLLSRKG